MADQDCLGREAASFVLARLDGLLALFFPAWAFLADRNRSVRGAALSRHVHLLYLSYLLSLLNRGVILIVNNGLHGSSSD